MKKTISATSMSTYITCPMQYYFKYVLELLQPYSSALETWIKVHQFIEDFDNWKEVVDDWSEEYKMFEIYKNNPVDWFRLCNEKIFNIDLDDWFVFTWKIDRVDDDKVIDWKTTSTDYKEEDVKKWIQTLLYPYWEFVSSNIIKDVLFYVINKKKYKKKWYKPQIIRCKITKKDIEMAKDKLQWFIWELKKWEFTANPWSHCWYCPFWPWKNWTKNCQQEYEGTKRWDTE